MRLDQVEPGLRTGFYSARQTNPSGGRVPPSNSPPFGSKAAQAPAGAFFAPKPKASRSQLQALRRPTSHVPEIR
jgi:hypothetical protein